MTSSISKLQAEIQELEKRVKAISATQTTLSQLIEMRKYFENAQSYLTSLNDEFNSHLIDCDEYEIQIQNILSQIEAINAKLENSTNDSDLVEINTKIEQLTSNLNDALNQIETIKSGSTNTIAQLSTDMENMQIDIETIQDSIDEINTEISSTNALISDHQTQINNLSSTQNTLTTTTSNLNSRLTAAEQEITALNGGVDLTELDERVSKSEAKNYLANCFAYKKINYNLTPHNKKLYTNEYYYSTCATKMVLHKIKFNYQACSGGSMTISMLLNNQIVSTITINLAQYPNCYEFTNFNIPVHKHQIIKFNCEFTEIITIESLEMFIIGEDVNFYEYNRDLKIHCFDNYTYITKIDNGVAYYDKIAKDQTIDLSNLSKQLVLSGEDYSYNEIMYAPFIECNGSQNAFVNMCDAILYTYSDSTRLMYPEDPTSTDLTVQGDVEYAYTDVVYGWYARPASMFVGWETFRPMVYNLNGQASNRDYPTLENYVKGEWLYATGVKNNYRTMSSSIRNIFNCCCIALNEDGYMYFIPKINATYALKIGRGITASAYYQEDKTIHVYLNHLHTTDKYVLTENSSSVYESQYVETYNNCDHVYEAYNNTLIKHNPIINDWIAETI